MKTILMVSMLIALALVIAACTPAEDTGLDVVGDTTGDAMDEKDVMEEDAADEGYLPMLPADVLSQPTCTDEKTATVIVTNNQETDWDIEALEFRLNDNVDSSPECDKATIAPGEETTCSGLDEVVLRTDVRSVIQLFTPDGESHEIGVRCTE